jgi:hypothetical protein
LQIHAYPARTHISQVASKTTIAAWLRKSRYCVH